jgi:hypothetical protein
MNDLHLKGLVLVCHLFAICCIYFPFKIIRVVKCDRPTQHYLFLTRIISLQLYRPVLVYDTLDQSTHWCLLGLFIAAYFLVFINL